jgi:hypothetical protein
MRILRRRQDVPNILMLIGAVLALVVAVGLIFISLR